MAKANSLLRMGSRRQSRSVSEPLKIEVEKAHRQTENVMTILLMSALETVTQDFDFTAEQAIRFRELVQARALIKLNALK